MDILSPEKIAQLKAVLKEMDVSSANESLIQDNKIVFPYKDKIYRVRMPNQIEQTLAEEAQNKVKLRLTQEKGNRSRNQLIRDLKENNGLDVKALEAEKDGIKEELQYVYLELAVVPSEFPDKIEALIKKKEEIELRFMEIFVELAEVLEPCIQEQAKIEFYRFLAFTCAEVKTGKEDFTSVWETYDDCKKDGSGLSTLFLNNLQSLLLKIKE
jgi:hypothetical protein